MPTYVCWSRAGLLSDEQRQRIAKSITEIHHEVARAPRYFVQVIFSDLAPGSHFVGGSAAQDDHVWIRADIRAGRTQQQKEQLLTRIADEVSTIAGSSRENIWVYISDIPGPSVLEFGRILPLPGEEESWFENLPLQLQERLRSPRLEHRLHAADAARFYAAVAWPYSIARKSAMRPGPVGCQPRRSRVHALEARMSSPANIASQPK